MEDEKIEVYDKRQHGKTDAPAREKYRKRKCAACGSKRTVLLFESKTEYTNEDGWYFSDHLREYKCLECEKYFRIQKSDVHREFYTRCS